MKIIILKLSILLIFLSCDSSSESSKYPILDDVDYTNLVWSDEFDYTGEPAPEKWSFDVEGNIWDWGNKEEQNYTPAKYKNAWVEDNNLIIEARKQTYISPEDDQERNYTSARLRTLNKGDWTYGRFDIRAKIPTGNGAWPAIWMLPSDDKYGIWPNSGEIDIMEHVYIEQNTIFGTAWTQENEKRSGDGGSKYINDLADNYHVYSIIWSENTIKFLIDNEQYCHFYKLSDSSSKWPFDQRFHLLLNIAVGGEWSPEVDDSIFPTRMYIDYIRVYQ